MLFQAKPWLIDIIRAENTGATRHGNLRLDKSEWAVPFPEGFYEQFVNSLSPEDFQAYPETESLKTRVAGFWQISPQQVALGAGVDAIIKMFYEVFSSPGARVVYTKPSFPMFGVYGDLFAVDATVVGYTPSLDLDLVHLEKEIDKGPALVLLANPNSPVGDFLSIDIIESLISRARTHGTAVLLDETYADFAPASAIELIGKYENLGVARSFSKALGGAGIRLAYVAGSQQLISLLAKWRPMYEVNQIAVKFGLYALQHHALFSSYAQKIMSEREKLGEVVTAAGFKYFGSHTNFVHFEGGGRTAKAAALFDRANILYKTGSLPYRDGIEWIRMSLTPDLHRHPAFSELANL